MMTNVKKFNIKRR